MGQGGKPILCLDFDGVIHSYASGWVSETFIPDPPVLGAFEFLYSCRDVFDVRIFSSRSKTQEGRVAMYTWLKYWADKALDNTEPLWRANAVINMFNRGDAWPAEKPPAFLTIDDRAITFCGKWPSMRELQDFKPWYK